MRYYMIWERLMRSSGPKFENSKITAIRHVFRDAIVGFLRACYPILIYFGITLLVQVVLGLIFPEGVLALVLAQGIGSLVAIPYLLTVYRKDILVFSASRSVCPQDRPGKKEQWFRWIYAAVTIALFAVAVNNLIGFSQLEQMSKGYASLKENMYAGSVVVQLIFYGGVIPYAEELLYRGIIFGRMKQTFRTQKAIIISAVVFGLMHFNLVQFVYATIIGLVLAFFTDRYGGIVPAILGHAAANVIAVIRAAGGLPTADMPILHLILTIIFLAASVSLFGMQFRVERLK